MGCELCGDWPVVLRPKCHPTAPLRLEMPDRNTLVAYCYVPSCNRKVAEFKVSLDSNDSCSLPLPAIHKDFKFYGKDKP